MDLLDPNATVHLSGAEEAAKTAVELQEKIIEAKTLAGELAALIQNLKEIDNLTSRVQGQKSQKIELKLDGHSIALAALEAIRGRPEDKED